MVRNILDEDVITFYNVKDIKEIFKLDSERQAYRLMNTPGFPVTIIGRSKRVNAAALKKFISQNMMKPGDTVIKLK